MSAPVSLNDPAHVREQYATEAALAARKSVYRDVTGPDARQLVLELVAGSGPRRVLEVGCGEGELAEQLATSLTAEVVAVDQSPRMVELTRARGVDARVADVQDLPFPNGAFDVVVAAWMLYHVADIDRGLDEIARVLRPGGLLVAVTNGREHLAELFALGGVGDRVVPFNGENGEAVLSRRFAEIERIEADGTVTFDDVELIRSYYASSPRLTPYLDHLPARLDAPLIVRRRPVLFTARSAT